jgi:hypothetical protein
MPRNREQAAPAAPVDRSTATFSRILARIVLDFVLARVVKRQLLTGRNVPASEEC